MSLSVMYAPTAEPSVAFYRYLLPPIIFYAGISVKKKQFFRNFASIASFGVLGTYIAFAVIACVLYVFSKLPNILNFSVSYFLAISSAGASCTLNLGLVLHRLHAVYCVSSDVAIKSGLTPGNAYFATC